MAFQACWLHSLVTPAQPTLMHGRSHVRHIRYESCAQGAVRCASGAGAPATPPLRRTADYQPTQWHDSFIQTLTSDIYTDEAHMAKLEDLKGRVRCLIHETAGVAAELELLDVLRRFGVAYHFEREIDLVLLAMSTNVEDIRRELDGNLLHTALLFRLLREHGLEVSQDVFDSLRDEQGSFSGSLRDDPEGLLSLYESSFLAFEREKMLEDARAFAMGGLKELITLDGRVDAELKERVEYALEMPLHWRVPRVYTRWFIDVYEREGKVNPVLLELAKQDFNMVQSQHRRDVRAMSRWWDELGLQNLSFFRDRIMENFLSTIGVAFEPLFSHARYGLTKVNCLVTAIDDFYDVYGTIDELEAFTKAVERWDIGAMEELPKYMKSCFHALLNTTNDLAQQCYEEKGFNCLAYLKKSWADLCKSYLVEARWYHSKHMPTLKEYLGNAWMSIPGPLLLTHAYFLLSEGITKEALNIIKNYGDLVQWSSIIVRLSNDLATSAVELKRGDAPKSIQCYMHEKNVSEEMAREYIKTLISDAWMKINEEYLINRQLPKSFVNTTLNIARSAQCIYQHGDGYGAPDKETYKHIKSLLIEPIHP